MKPPSAASLIGRTPVFRQVAVGMACASYWRGTWYVLDDYLFPEDTFCSAVASLGLGTVGLALCQGFAALSSSISSQEAIRRWNIKQWKHAPVARFGALYFVATSCVLVWRGAWLLWDVAYEEAFQYYDMDYSSSMITLTETIDDGRGKERTQDPTEHRLLSTHSHHHSGGSSALASAAALPASTTGTSISPKLVEANSMEPSIIRATDPHHRTVSGLLSHGLAVVGLLAVGRFASVLAPPARASIIRDAPLYAKTVTEYRKTANWLFK